MEMSLGESGVQWPVFRAEMHSHVPAAHCHQLYGIDSSGHIRGTSVSPREAFAR